MASRYRLQAPLGAGAAGVVWRADDIQLGHPVAVKILTDHEEGAHTRERFVHEARAAAALRSAHVVQVLDAGEHDGVPFLAMELLEGETLGARLDRGPLGKDETWSLFYQVGQAIGLAHAHGIVHRDIKPLNIFLVATDGPYPLAKILDFGIAKLRKSLMAMPIETKTGTRLGTPYYMSPEQLRSTKMVDHRADLWSLAVVAYHCLVGERPFSGAKFGELVIAVCARPPPVPSARGPVPPGFDAWFAHAVARDIDARFSTCEAMIQALGEVLTA